VGPAKLTGTTAVLPLEVPSVPGHGEGVLDAQVTVTANGGQRFVVAVSLAVAPPVPAASPLAMTAAPADTAVVPVAQVKAPSATPLATQLAEPARASAAVDLRWLHLLPLLPLFLLLMAVIFRDTVFGPEVTAPSLTVQVRGDKQDAGLAAAKLP